MLLDTKRTHKRSDSANSHSQSPGNTARDGEEQLICAHGGHGEISSPVGLEKAQRLGRFFPSGEPLLALQPESQGFVHLQPEVLSTGSREK